MLNLFDALTYSNFNHAPKAADNLMKLYKSDDLDDKSRKKLIEFEGKLRIIFKQVDEIDKEVEEMARRKRIADGK